MVSSTLVPAARSANVPAVTAPVVPGALDARAAGLMVLLGVVWSLQQVSLKAVADDAAPMLMLALRSLLALVPLAVLMRWRGERLHRETAGPGAVVGLLFALEYLLLAEALRLTHASHVVVFLYTAPVFAALGLHLRLPAERLAALQWVGIAVAFSGVAVAFLGGGAGATVSHAVLVGDALALAAAVAWAATTVVLRCSTLATAPATETLLYQLLGAVVLLSPAAWLTGQAWFEPSARVVAHLAFQSVVVAFASILTWCWLLRHYLASRLGVFSFLTPLFGVVFGVVLLGEPLDAGFVAGSGLVLAGIMLVSGHAAVARAARVLESRVRRGVAMRRGRPVA